MIKKLLRIGFTIFGKLRLGPFVGAAALVVKDGKILLNKERLGYSLPGGLVNYNEDPQDAVIREVREETGFSVLLKKRIDVYTKPRKGAMAHSILFLYECEVIAGEIKNSWEGKPEWVDIEKIPYDKMQHGYAEILKKYFKN